MISIQTPLVSIITPCFNGEPYLDRYFSSILNQTYSSLELIFINDGSSDRTGEIAERYRPLLEEQGIHFIYLYQENAGQATALNRGLKLFTGDYLTWPDADDEMTPDSIEKKVRYLQAHPELQMVRSDGIYHNTETGARQGIARDEDKATQNIVEKLLLVHTYGCCGCYMISRELLLECYPNRDFFESRAGQNWQLLVPAASRSLCGYIDEALYIVYEHGDSHSRQQRNTEQMYHHWDTFTEVLRHAIDASQCEKKRCLNLVEENRARQQFYIAVSVRDKARIRSTADLMGQFGKMTLKEKLLCFKCLYLK